MDLLKYLEELSILIRNYAQKAKDFSMKQDKINYGYIESIIE